MLVPLLQAEYQPENVYPLREFGVANVIAAPLLACVAELVDPDPPL